MDGGDNKNCKFDGGFLFKAEEGKVGGKVWE